MLEAFLTGAIAGYGIAIPVGAIAILIIQTGIRRGFRSAFLAGAGAASADLIYASVALVGGAALTAVVSSIGDPLRIASGAVLIVIAVNGLARARRPVVPPDAASPQGGSGIYWRFLGLTMINPTTVVYFAAVIIGLGIAEGMTAVDGLVFALGAFLASLSWQTALAAAGGLVGRRVTERAQRAAIVGGNLVILAMAALIIS